MIYQSCHKFDKLGSVDFPELCNDCFHILKEDYEDIFGTDGFIKVAKLSTDQQSALKDYWGGIFPKEYVEALIK